MKLIEMQGCQGLFSVDSQAACAERGLREESCDGTTPKANTAKTSVFLPRAEQPVWRRGGGVKGGRLVRQGGDAGGLRRDAPEPSAPVDKVPPDIN